MLEVISLLFLLFVSNRKPTHTLSSVVEHVEELSTNLCSRLCCASQEPALGPRWHTGYAWLASGESSVRRKKALFAGMTEMNCSFCRINSLI